MTYSSVPYTGSSGTNPWTKLPSHFALPLKIMHPELSLRWGLYNGTDAMPVSYGQVDALTLINRVSGLLKLESQHRERLAAVSMDPGAKRLLCALDRETSIKWEDLPTSAKSDWVEASRAAALLAGANLCDVSPTRIRLSEIGDKVLAGSPTLEGIYSEIGPTPVQ